MRPWVFRCPGVFYVSVGVFFGVLVFYVSVGFWFFLGVLSFFRCPWVFRCPGFF